MVSKNIKKVEITNFPKRGIWDYINITATIIALTVAFISLMLYVNELNKNPDLEIIIDSLDTEQVTQSSFDENEFIVYVQLINRGKEISKTASLKIIFSPQVNVFPGYSTTIFSEDSQWNKELISNFDNYIFHDKSLMIAKGINKQIGTFNLKIPETSEEILIAVFVLEGDFERKFGVVYYKNGKFTVKQSTHDNPTAEPFAFDLWNKNITTLKERGIY